MSRTPILNLFRRQYRREDHQYDFPPNETKLGETLSEDDLISRSEWDEHIYRKNKEQSWLEDIVRFLNIPCGDQNGTNYCHAFAALQCLLDARAIEGQPFIQLSAMSIGGPVTGWKNKGASPRAILTQLHKHGACPVSMTDGMYSLNYKNWDPGWTKERAKYKVSEWTNGLLSRGKAFDALATAAIRGWPCYIGFRWWWHTMSGGYRLLKLPNGKYAVRNRNCAGTDYGNDGFTDMVEGRGTPDINLYMIRTTAPTG